MHYRKVMYLGIGIIMTFIVLISPMISETAAQILFSISEEALTEYLIFTLNIIDFLF